MVDEQPYAGLSIDEITVEEIYLTSVGGVARARARGRDLLLRAGDRLADGEVDRIDFVKPTVAWLRFNRRVHSPPGIPYRPVVWLLAGEPSELEVHRLGDELIASHRFLPWTWEPTIERAPHLFAEMVGPSEVRELGQDLGDRVRLQLGFGTVDILLNARPASLLPRPPEKPPEPAPDPVGLETYDCYFCYEHDDSYDPGLRRDPFFDLSAGVVPRPQPKGPRPEGIPGLLIDEVEVEGSPCPPVSS